jgi:tetratricopeptide (TPR) repeat protein
VLVVAVLARLLLAPQEAGPLVEKGYQAINERTLDTAERYFRDAVALDARNARACLGLGFCLGRAGIDDHKIVDQRKLDEALSLTEQAGQIDPQLRADCHAQLACFKYWLALYESEAREMEQAVELVSSSLKYHERLGLAYWRAGKQTQSAAYYKKAIQEFQDILKADPSYPKVFGYVKQLQDNFLAPQSGAQTSTLTARNRR